MDEGIIYGINREILNCPTEVLKCIYFNMYRGSEDKLLSKKYIQFSTKLTWTWKC